MKRAADMAYPVLATRPVERLLRPLTARTVTVLMLHRVKQGGEGYEAVPVCFVADCLSRLVERGYCFVSVAQLLAGEVAARPGLVCLTADDGYVDQATLLAEVTVGLGIPLAIFVTTGFIDGGQINWWDRISYCLVHSRNPTISVPIPGVPPILELSDCHHRHRAAQTLQWALKQLPHDQMDSGLAAIAAATGVRVPEEPPDEFRPLSWDQARRLEEGGLVSFGPHSVTHPILSRTRPDQARTEVAESWARVSAELARPLPVFCYPNGEEDDFGQREERLVEEEGMRGAFAVDGRPASLDSFTDAAQAFRLSRVVFPSRRAELLAAVSGVKHLKERYKKRRRNSAR